MEGAIILIWGYVFAAGLFVLFDWLGRRKDRQSKEQRAP
jgi:hypothetical protein